MTHTAGHRFEPAFREGESPREARFDPALNAWILSTYADVVAGLRDPRLSAAGGGVDDAAVHESLRESAADVLAAGRMAAWRPAMLSSARTMARDLPADRTVDLVAAFARPWARSLAMMLTGAPPAEAERMTGLAREIFLAAAHATDARREPAALTATAELARALSAADPVIAVQAFVALAETLPCLLAGVWLELFRRPQLVEQVLQQSMAADLLPRVLSELMRLAGPDRAVFRRALSDTTIGNATIASGDPVILMLAAANRDAMQFPDPDEVDLSRHSGPHMTFGGGPHRCAGASLVRMALTIATAALLETASCIEVIAEVEWLGGFAIRSPATLPVLLRREPVEAIQRIEPGRRA